MHGMEPIIDYLKRRLKEAGPVRWDAIAKQAGVASSLLRKLVYDSRRDNPRVQTVQPLLDYFAAVDAGKKELPWDGVTERRGAERPAAAPAKPKVKARAV